MQEIAVWTSPPPYVVGGGGPPAQGGEIKRQAAGLSRHQQEMVQNENECDEEADDRGRAVCYAGGNGGAGDPSPLPRARGGCLYLDGGGRLARRLPGQDAGGDGGGGAEVSTEGATMPIESSEAGVAGVVLARRREGVAGNLGPVRGSSQRWRGRNPYRRKSGSLPTYKRRGKSTRFSAGGGPVRGCSTPGKSAKGLI